MLADLGNLRATGNVLEWMPPGEVFEHAFKIYGTCIPNSTFLEYFWIILAQGGKEGVPENQQEYEQVKETQTRRTNTMNYFFEKRGDLLKIWRARLGVY